MNRKLLLVIGLAIAAFSCNPKRAPQDKATIEKTDTINFLTPNEIADGWKLLWDGKTFEGWHTFNKDSVVGWEISNGMLISLGLGGDYANDIVTDNEYENFELSIDWKLSSGGNSGIFYNAVEKKHPQIYAIAPEYQLIDDIGFPEKIEEWQKTAACYGMYTAKADKKLKPIGEFNTSKIIVDKGHVEHWLNGEKVVEYQLRSADWDKKIKEGKWEDFPDYGTAFKGKIGIQDHGQSNSFKNIKIKVL